MYSSPLLPHLCHHKNVVLDETNARGAAVRPETGGRSSVTGNGSGTGDDEIDGWHAAAADVERTRRDTHRLRCRLLPILLRLASDNDWQVLPHFDAIIRALFIFVYTVQVFLQAYNNLDLPAEI